MLLFFLRGLPFGLTAAVMPGPYQLFLFSEAAKHGWRKTWPLAFVPLLSDGPVILIVFAILSQVPEWFLTALKIVGGLFILYLAYGAFKASSQTLMLEGTKPTQGLLKGVAMNFFNPNPWIFWSLTGVPILLEGWRQAANHGVSFIFGFYTAMIPTLFALVVIFAVAAHLGPKVNQTLQKIAALALAGFGIYQLVQGITEAFQHFS
jgi:threonine/homoserine/homoserine lactone efflux protein